MANRILIFIDGQQIAHLNISKNPAIKFLADEDAKLVKVMLHSDEGLSLLATLLLNRNEIEKYLPYRLWRGRKQYYARQENGDELILCLGLNQNNFTIELKYQQKLELKSIRQWFSAIIYTPHLLALPFNLTIIIIAILICLLPISYYIFSPLAIAPDINRKTLPSPVQPQETITANPSISREKSVTPNIVDITSKPKPKERDDRTMSINTNLDLELHRVRNIYIELFSETSRDEQLAVLLSEEIKAIGFTITSEKSAADAILAGKIDNHKDTIFIKLINGRGKVLFANNFNLHKDLNHTANQIGISLTKAKLSNKQK